jgi:hypothetical protein
MFCLSVDITAHSGSTSLILQTPIVDVGKGMSSLATPLSVTNTTGSWAVASGSISALLTFSDGTKGFVDGQVAYGTVSSVTYVAGDAQNERAIIFRVPFDTKVDALWTYFRFTDASSGGTLKLYSDPLGTPTVLASKTIEAEDVGNASANACYIHTLSTPVSLSANTDYAVGLLATGTTALRMERMNLYHEEHRQAFPAGNTIFGALRGGSTGAFSSLNSTVLTACGVRLCEFPSEEISYRKHPLI